MYSSLNTTRTMIKIVIGTALIIGGSLIIRDKLIKLNRKRKKLPSGPSGYPLFGNLASPGNANDQGANGSHLLNLNASDTVDVRSMNANTDYFGTMTSFSGFFVG